MPHGARPGLLAFGAANALEAALCKTASITLEERLEHVDDCRATARRHSLPRAPFFDQGRLNLKINIAVFCPIPVKWEAAGYTRLIISAKKLIVGPTTDRGALARLQDQLGQTLA